MSSEISGKVVYANGRVASGVEVRVFDKDAPGKTDDDLTLTAGLTDSRGQFKVIYDPGRYMDFINVPMIGLQRPTRDASGKISGGLNLPNLFDILSPYLQFSYPLNGQTRIHTTSVVLFQTHYELPDALPVSFKPSENGFQFPNAFRGYMLPFTLPFLPDASKVPGVYGLCGGMSSAACDFILAGQPVPAVTDVPRGGTRFQQYLFRRAMDTFALGESILRFARWMALPEEGLNGTQRLTLAEMEKIIDVIDSGRPCVTGLVYAKGSSLQEISKNVWNNHQVLAISYNRLADGSIDLHLYDPNYPKDDTVLIHAERVQVGSDASGPVFGLHCTEMRAGKPLLPVRGLFPMPYEPAEPPGHL